MNSFDNKIVIHTDGACSGNPGPGGWGAIVAFPEGTVRELGGKISPTTNNQMELQAVISALHFARAREEDIVICTDSTYVIRGISQWIWGWMKRGWVNSEGKPVSNIPFWKELLTLTQAKGKKSITWNYVRGHNGNSGNERCDAIAVSFSKGQYCELYEGPLLQYEHNPYDIPEDTSLPEIKESKAKVAAFSYLSVVNGIVQRHSNWGDCERTVKGRPGAKFKKSTSTADEEIILASWGYSIKDIK